MPKRNFTFIEVCAGAGGMSSGFIKSGFTPILLNDNNKTCCKTLELNHEDADVFHGSMEDIDISKYKNIDVLIGGVPCQSFSIAGKRLGTNDKRGKLMFSFIKMLETLKPKVFMIENVKGLKNINKGETLKNILETIDKLKLYNVSYKILNANDYGVPQKRERLFIVGTLNKLTKFKFPKKKKIKPVLKDVLLDCPSSDGHEYPEKKKKLFDMIPQDGCWINLPEKLQKEYLGKSYDSGGGKRGILKRLSMDKPSLTLLCSPSQKQTERCHPTKTRPLQILEYSRIQTFPDDYSFSGSTNQIYKQIGNAVPVKLAYLLAKQIKKVLK
jgi:DNA (cytosine-5)-methyltransferase 1